VTGRRDGRIYAYERKKSSLKDIIKCGGGKAFKGTGYRDGSGRKAFIIELANTRI
jgi:hypothetical protein